MVLLGSYPRRGLCVAPRRWCWLAGAVALIHFATGAWAHAAKFLGLSDLPGGTFISRGFNVSADGSVAVGRGTSSSGTEAFRWTNTGGMVGLGDLAGGNFFSIAYEVSADGTVVVGQSVSALGTEAFRWTSTGGMVGLGDLEGGTFESQSYDVSADGSVVVGPGNSASGPEAYRWTSGTGMVGLGDLPGGTFNSFANSISADGMVSVGQGNSASGPEAFRWTSAGGMVGMGDLAGGSFDSEAIGLSADGSVIVGYGNNALGLEAFRWTSGSGLVGLGDLAGGGSNSFANAVSADGSIIVGQGTSAAGGEAFVWDALNGMRSLKDVLLPSVGTALNGWTLTIANTISLDGRTVVGLGTNPSGNPEAWLAYLPDQLFWFPESSGSWDAETSWSGPFLPGPADDVVIDPAAALTVAGPGANRMIKSLTLGGSGIGRATLRLEGATGGDLNATSSVTIQADGELVLANGRTLTAPTMTNFGVVRGTGTVNANLTNQASGELRVSAGESLVVSGGGHSNTGKIEVIGGSLEFIGLVTNAANTGFITGRSAALRFQNGLTNNGSLLLSSGVNDLAGDVTNSAGGKIIVAGGAHATFHDDVTQNFTLQVIKVGSTNSVAVFAGSFSGSGGSSGGGDIFFLGDLRPGNSAATVTFANNVGFGHQTVLEIELGGVTPGSGYDQVHVAGALSLDGALEVSLINGFTPASGNSFDILDWTSLSGTFSTIQLPVLTAGLDWDTSQLYTIGALSVVFDLPGDYNGNGSVDAADYVVWRDTLGESGAGLAADGNGSGAIDAGDFDVWRANFGQTVASSVIAGPSPSASVPEPATITLVTVIAAACVVARYRLARMRRRK